MHRSGQKHLPDSDSQFNGGRTRHLEQTGTHKFNCNPVRDLQHFPTQSLADNNHAEQT